MKNTYGLLVMVLFFAGSPLCLAESSANAEAFYRQGLAAERAGDADAARAAYEQALRINPRHADATFRMGQLRLRRDVIARQAREKAFNSVMLREIKLEDAELRESLDALAKMVEAITEEQVTPNFILQDPDGRFADVRVTLNLRNVTAGAVLEYMLSSAKARARHDEYAIVILPN